MKKTILAISMLLLGWAAPLPAEIMTYQGRLKDNSLPANGNYAFAFDFCDASQTACFASTDNPQNFLVANGLFKSTFTMPSVDLSAQAWYLRVSVGGSVLSPMERLTAVPYSIYASSAGYSPAAVQKTGSVMSGQLTLAGSTLTVTGNEFSVGVSTFVVKNGYVGIGTASPSNPLQVSAQGQYVFSANSASTFATLNLVPSGAGTARLNNNAGAASKVALSVGHVDHLVVAGSGNVGISSTTPAYRLVVSSGAGEAGNIVVISTGNSNVIRMTGGGEVFATRFIGDGSGITGVTGATGTDATKLPLAGGTLTGNLLVHDSTLSVTGGGLSVSSAGAAAVGMLTDIGGGHIRTQSGHPLYLGAAGADTMVLDVGGKVGVSMSAPLYPLHVGGAGAFSGQLIAGGTVTVQGNAFSVGGSTLAVAAGKVGIGSLPGSATLTIGGGVGNEIEIPSAGTNVQILATGSPGQFQIGGGSTFEVNVNGGNKLIVDSAGNVGIDAGVPAARLDLKAAGSGAADMAQVWRNSAGAIVSSVSATGYLQAAKFIGDGSGLTNVAAATGTDATKVLKAGDTMSGQLTLAGSTLTVTGSAFSVGGSTLSVVAGRAGVGTAVPAYELDVVQTIRAYNPAGGNGRFILGDGDIAHGMTSLAPTTDTFGLLTANSPTGGLHLAGYSSLGTASGLYLAGVIGDADPADGLPATVISGARKNGLASQPLGAAETVLAVNNGGGAALVTVLGGGNVGLSTGAPQARLDVLSAAGMMAQIWRDSAGVIVSSVSPAGYLQAVKFIGDGSGLTNVAAATGIDNTKLPLAGGIMTGQLTNTSSVTITGYGGIYGLQVSSNVSLAGALYSANGNIGIGTASPEYMLHVNKTNAGAGNVIAVRNSDVTNVNSHAHLNVEVGGAGGGNPVLLWSIIGAQVWAAGVDNSDSDKWKLAANTNGALTTGTKLAVTTSGDVGIGTAAPGAKLDVAGLVRSTWAFSPGDGSGFQSTRYMYDDPANYRTAFSSSVYVLGYSSAAKYYGDGSGLTGVFATDSSKLPLAGGTLTGYLGIGTGSPQHYLHLSSNTSTSSNTLLKLSDTGTGAPQLLLEAGGHQGRMATAASNGGTYIGTLTNDFLVFETNAAERLKIAADGKIGTGGINPTEALDIASRVQISTYAGNVDTDGLYSFGINGIKFANGGNTYMRVAGGGSYVGMGGPSVFSNTNSPKLQVQGSLSVGSSYNATNPPANSLVVENSAGIGTSSPASKLEIAGGSVTISGAEAGLLFDGSARKIAPTTNATLGAGLYVSTNVYVIGFSSASKYYGDGSGLTGVSGDNLGNHTATKMMAAGYGIQASTIEVTGNAFSVGGSTLVATNGRIGIGKLPAADTILDIGYLQSSGESQVALYNSASKNGKLRMRTDPAFDILTGAPDTPIRLSPGGSTLVTLKPGAVGINTPIPDSLLHVDGGSVTISGALAAFPYALKAGDNGLIISTGGAVQTIGMGNGSVAGAARGTGAVDLQTSRLAAAQAATGNYSVIGGGYGNTASAANSVVAGGQQNTASNSYASVGGGITNTASSAYSTVAGGMGGKAAGAFSNVAGGYNNEVHAEGSAAGGGEYNVVSGSNSVIAGGRYNTVYATSAVIAGGENNSVKSGSMWGAIAGGRGNAATGPYGAISGGRENKVNSDAYAGFIGGGAYNISTAPYSAVGGGLYNTSSGTYSGVFSGHMNEAAAVGAAIAGGEGNYAGGQYSFIGSGQNNQAPGNYSAIGGGAGNSTNLGQYSFIGAGANNVVNSLKSVIGGGDNNQIASVSNYSGIFSGQDNQIPAGVNAVIGGGYTNVARADFTTVSGGLFNYASAYGATVAGGANAAASGQYSMVAGGNNNTALGNYSFAAGSRSSSTAAGTFTWSDSTALVPLVNSVADQVMFKAAGGFWVSTGTVYGDPAFFVDNQNRVGIGTSAPGFKLHVRSSGGAVAGLSTSGNSTDAAVYGWSNSAATAIKGVAASGYAGRFEGNVFVTNDGVNPSLPAKLQVNGDVGLGNGTQTGNAPVVIWLTAAAAVVDGDIVVASGGNQFSTTVTGSDYRAIGVAVGGTAASTVGKVAVGGVAVVNCSGATAGQHAVTSAVAGQAVGQNNPTSGTSIGQFLTSCGTPAAGKAYLLVK